MGTTWVGALARAAAALGRRRCVHEGEESDVTDESGFTLIELMVVLLIMGILMAIAIPTFLGVTSTANDTSTQSNLTNVITAAKAIYAKADTYPKTATMATQLQGGEPEFSYVTGSSPKQHTISVKTGATATNTTLVVAAYMTKTNVCWVAKASDKATSTGVTYNLIDTATGKTTDKAGCTATAGGALVTGWTSKWPLAPPGH